MSEFVIHTDSSCDIDPALLCEWGVPYVSLTLRFDGEDKEYFDDKIDPKEFYNRMRDGGVAKTAAINSEIFTASFEKVLSDGKDLIYFGLSSGLSTTFNSARLAAEALREKYPERKIFIIDSRTASAGTGLFLYLLVQKKNAGATIEEVVEYAESLIPKLCHWFTVDDLVYLKRGGRVSAAAAFFGNALGIKPVLHVDDEGHLTPTAKIRGRKMAIKTLADKYTELADDPENGTIFISHGDCIDEVEQLAGIIKEKHGANVEIITHVGPVIGAHSGPGTIALFFVGKER